MSITLPANVSATSQTNNTASFEQKLNAAKSSQVLVEYLKESGKSAINEQELAALANNTNGNVSSEVSAAASYMVRHEDVFTAIETHDVAGEDGLSGVWNLEWAAAGGLEGSSVEAIAAMTEAFDRAIGASAKITEITTESKTDLDATKQRAQN
ncbi:hypothetical protein GAO09_24975 [Rhizobiales bacterium RZME27]|jgi:hypothetical protein|uniref:Uncharacterized protein n=1 Tax=Endobacterium cereale TaxID=2663029 RepID=A0A6A8AEW0_9HYPH|nr:hypothetical protein [Endobacterium cereale]MEB2847446.1 hypothetical protein [Endobacterium cereale]MQY49294.1 hypothetical protein [Endobacterium cereale]